jgi:hypothetical protein
VNTWGGSGWGGDARKLGEEVHAGLLLELLVL